MGRAEDCPRGGVAGTRLRFRPGMIGPLVLAVALVWVAVAGYGDLAGGAAAGAAPAGADSEPAGQAGSGKYGAGAPAPDFDFTTLDGQRVRLQALRGQPVVLNFFASWCDPCREEGPVVRAMADAAGARGYSVLGVAMQDTRQDAARFMAAEGLTFPAGLDLDGKIARAYRVIGPPTTYFISADGIIRYVFMGPLTPDRVQLGLTAAAVRGGAGAPAAPAGALAAGGAAAAPAAPAGPDAGGAAGSSAGVAGLAVALGFGLLSFLSPCVLPLLPAYLGYMSGLSAGELHQEAGAPARRRRLQSHTLAFTLGLILVFTALGASASLVGGWLNDYRSLFARVAGLLVLAYGLQMMGLLHLSFLYREFRPDPGARPEGGRGGLFRALSMGAAFALGWTPCVGPMLGSILVLASREQTVGQGILLLLAYGLGLGIPFVVAGLAVGRVLGAVAGLRRHLGLVGRLSGALLVGMGLLLVADRLGALGLWLNKVL